MKNISSYRKSLTHLYNPKLEGVGLYDINYINAYLKSKKSKVRPHNSISERLREAA
tara:strand:+ start:397 stop:564 length:168 start_codon:yes stop_codon:yes gene_type:complete